MELVPTIQGKNQIVQFKSRGNHFTNKSTLSYMGTLSLSQ